MKISILSFDMGHNCLGRAYLLGKVLQRRYDVEILGTQFPSFGSTIWKPCDTGEFKYYTVKGGKFPEYFGSVKDLLKHISGDVIYASKLRFSSYGIGILKKLFSWKPIVLDIDDLETSWYKPEDWNKIKGHSFLNPIGYHHTKWIQGFIWMANEITTVSTQLQQRFGGVIIPHGRDTCYLDPSKHDGRSLRYKFGIQNKKIIMFLGTPRPHKGLEEVIRAITFLRRDDIRFIIVGKGSDVKYEKKLQELGGEKVILFDQIPFTEVPRYLSIADLVVIPQRRVKQTTGQIPAKVFDAMAMAKPIIATNVSDLPSILDGCGIIIEPEDIESLAYEIEWVFSHPNEVHELGEKARAKCIAEYSWDVMEGRLKNIFDRL
ncbi:MAG: glycosyltransferase family 4 protein [Ignavibacteriales bacterium]|nr:glycosyltransferase family 4 protein [Ignavibacteriales bacterium]